jgi:hypothetical protein
MRRLLPAALLSALFHFGLFGLLFLFSSPGQAEVRTETIVPEAQTEVAALPEEEHAPPIPLDVLADREEPSRDPGSGIDSPVIGPTPSPGDFDPLAPGGRADASMMQGPTASMQPAALRLGTSVIVPKPRVDPGTVPWEGLPFGERNARGLWKDREPGPGRIGRIEPKGGTTASEAAVARGLKWLVKQQASDGHWTLDGAFKDRGQNNDIAGTAFGLLPLLGSGYTHKAPKNAKDNPFEKPIEKGLVYLLRKQDKRTGNFGGGMYAHALAAIAVCEAYGMSQDKALRVPAQRALDYLVNAQHNAGGWRYAPGQAGDLSVTGWAVMALKSGQMAGLNVPENAWKKAQAFVDSCVDGNNEGYGYTAPGSTPTMSAVGLLCRQYLQGWGPNNLRMINGVVNNLKPVQPGKLKNMYYYYYATQVMHHFGGESWKAWNEKMRELLVKAQDNDQGPLAGSWSPVGDMHGGAGGRLMQTSLSILTLEVYYRHLPLYYRDSGASRVMGR